MRAPRAAGTSGRSVSSSDPRRGRRRTSSSRPDPGSPAATPCGRRAGPRSPPECPTWGLWGSPSWSVWAWCLRWSATQSRTEPWTAIEPSTANVRSSHGCVANARWVSRRWKPTVMPVAVSRYIPPRMHRSVTSTARFHKSRTAASTPTSGTTTPSRLASRLRAGHGETLSCRGRRFLCASRRPGPGDSYVRYEVTGPVRRRVRRRRSPRRRGSSRSAWPADRAPSRCRARPRPVPRGHRGW